MIDKGYDEYTVMAISGHSSTRMLARYTHPSEERKTEALGSLTEVFGHKPVTIGERYVQTTCPDLKELLGKIGGRQEARTPDLRVANAALSQLS